MDTIGVVDFLIEAGKLKGLPRTGWVESGVPDPESVADHSFRTALLAIILSDAQGLDSLKAVRMALLHDLAEAEIGDLTPSQKAAAKNHLEEEEEAMRSLLRLLPEGQSRLCLETWDEFTAGASPEARLVRDADKLEMVLQAMEYEKRGYDGSLMRFWHSKPTGGLSLALYEEMRRRR